jgi:hypothetical protein
MIIAAIVLAVGYVLIIGLCTKAAKADRVAETWGEPTFVPVSFNPPTTSSAPTLKPTS